MDLSLFAPAEPCMASIPTRAGGGIRSAAEVGSFGYATCAPGDDLNPDYCVGQKPHVMSSPFAFCMPARTNPSLGSLFLPKVRMGMFDPA